MQDFIPIFALFAVFGTITAIVFGPQVLKYREKRDMQETIRHAVDKGQQLPPELIDVMTKDVQKTLPSRTRDIRRGIIWLAVGIGIVMGGSQSLSRSLFSHLIPHGRESEFFSLYQAMERGTSWLGTFVFGLVYQLFHNYRLSIIALIVFFAVGGALLRTVDVRKGISDVGNEVPQVI